MKYSVLMAALLLAASLMLSEARVKHSHVISAKCDMRLHNDGTSIGTVEISESKKHDAVSISINLKSDQLKAGKHGFHIHHLGVVSGYDCKSTGGHYNPEGLTHGAPTDYTRHVGDLGNVVIKSDGSINSIIYDDVAKLNGPQSIVGRAVVIHDGTDDLGRGGDAGSKATGNAGGRVACCTLGVSEDEVVGANDTENY